MLQFALFEDGLSKLHLPPQVPVASLPSPAVMDIRPLLALASDKVEREDVFLNVNVVAYASMLA